MLETMAATITFALSLPIQALWLWSVCVLIRRSTASSALTKSSSVWNFLLILILALKSHCAGVSSLSLSSAPSSSSSSSTLKVAFVTGNSMKAREVQRIVQEHCFEGGGGDDDDDDDDDDECSLLDLELTVLDVDLPEIQEVDTLAIAKNKALLAAQLANGPCLVEDTSLCFNALGGMPGPYIKWFQQTLRSEGLYNILAAYPDKSATAVCTLAFSPAAHADPVLFTGECHGSIVPPEPGRGFGWDSIFVPNGSAHPFSQMSMEEKNELSHRGRAVRQWASWMGRNQQALLKRQQRTGSVLGHQGLKFSIRSPTKGTQVNNNAEKKSM